MKHYDATKVDVPHPIAETVHDEDGTYVVVWQTSMPGLNIAFRVLEDEWNEDHTVRTIIKIEVPGR